MAATEISLGCEERASTSGGCGAAASTEEQTEDHCEEALRQNIIEGCREMADLYLEVEREYHPLEEEVDQAFRIAVELK